MNSVGVNGDDRFKLRDIICPAGDCAGDDPSADRPLTADAAACELKLSPGAGGGGNGGGCEGRGGSAPLR